MSPTRVKKISSNNKHIKMSSVIYIDKRFLEAKPVKISQGERTKFDRFVDPNVRDAERRVYESIAIEFFLRLKIHKIGTYVTGFYKKTPIL